MLNRLLAGLFLAALAAPAISQTDPEQAPATEGGEKIQVVGQRPGPGLWKVSKGDHVLWIFGTYSPLPKNMIWRSHEVESIVAQSQEYIAPPSAQSNIGMVRQVMLAPLVIGLNKNPDGKTLKEVVPADVHARWLALKAKYGMDENDNERDRPYFAAMEISRRGLSHAGLSKGYEVTKAIEKIVRKNKLRTTSPKIELELNDPAKMIKEFKKGSLDDSACFAETLARMETDIDTMRVRAKAWAKGDIEVIEKLRFAEYKSACSKVIESSSVVRDRPGLQSVSERVRSAWLAAAEKALATNTSTFAVLHLDRILAADGYIAALKAMGYHVQQPE